MSKGLFITGTDTEIGKTYVSKLLIEALSLKHPVTYMKPVQTGCIENDKSTLQIPDLDYIMKGKCTLPSVLSDHVPYRFKTACSPHLAASLESTEPISIERIVTAYANIASHAIFTIVEGAGGIMVPLNDNTYMIDLMEALSLPIILVSSPHLGTLNHTILSINALRSRNIKLAGVVMNNVRNVPRDAIYRDNISYIRTYTTPCPLLETGYHSIKEQELNDFCEQIR